MRKMKICALGAALLIILLAFIPLTTAKVNLVSTTKSPMGGFLNKIRTLINQVIKQLFSGTTTNDDQQDKNNAQDDPPANEEGANEEDQPPAIEENEQDLCDLNGNGIVDTYDLELLKAFYGQDNPPFIPSRSPDIDQDGDVDLSDLAAVLGAYGSCDENALEDLNGDLEVNDCDVQIVRAFYGRSYDTECVKSADINQDGEVNLSDLSTLLANID